MKPAHMNVYHHPSPTNLSLLPPHVSDTVEQGIPTRVAAQIAGVNWRTLLRWIQRGALSPELYRGHPGSKGAAYRWGFTDLVVARAIAELRRMGVNPSGLRKAAVSISKQGTGYEAARLVRNSRGEFHVLSGDSLRDAVTQSGEHAVYPLDGWAAEILRQLAGPESERERKTGQ